MGKGGKQEGLEMLETPGILLNGEEMFRPVCQPMSSELKANLRP